MASKELVELLETVLAPFPAPQKAQMLRWASRAMDTEWVVQIVTDDKGNVWEIGSPSPHNKDHTIFAIMFDEAGRVVAYSVAQAVDDSGRTAVLYYKEMAFTPTTAAGPLTGDAMFADWEALLAREGDPPTAAAPQPVTNGVSP